MNAFRNQLSGLLDDADGMALLDTHKHNTEVTVGGTTLARVVEILSPYTITFENLQYAVRLVGANNNIPDVTNINQVSVRSQNSAGLVVSGSAVTAQDKLDIADRVHDELLTDHTTTGSLGNVVADIKTATRSGGPLKNQIFSLMFMMLDSDGVSKTGLSVSALISKDGAATVPTTNAPIEIGSGFYSVLLTAAEMNATMIGLRFTATGARTQAVSIATYAPVPA